MIEKLCPEGIINIYEISENWAQDKAEFDYYWLPETRVINGIHRIVRPARVSDGEKHERSMLKEPVHNLITTTGISLLLTNMAVASLSNQPFSQILSVGNGAITGVTRADTAVAGDGFTTGARKAPTSLSHVGFLITLLINFGTGDAVGTLTNVGMYGYNVLGSQNATTTAGTGSLMTHALFPFVKGATAYSVSYAFLMTN